MDNQGAVAKTNQKIFCPPFHAFDLVSRENSLQACRDWPTQSSLPYDYAGDLLALYVWGNTAFCSFYFW
jgi:hypothetical protein